MKRSFIGCCPLIVGMLFLDVSGAPNDMPFYGWRAGGPGTAVTSNVDMRQFTRGQSACIANSFYNTRQQILQDQFANVAAQQCAPWGYRAAETANRQMAMFGEMAEFVECTLGPWAKLDVNDISGAYALYQSIPQEVREFMAGGGLRDYMSGNQRLWKNGVKVDRNYIDRMSGELRVGNTSVFMHPDAMPLFEHFLNKCDTPAQADAVTLALASFVHLYGVESEVSFSLNHPLAMIGKCQPFFQSVGISFPLDYAEIVRGILPEFESPMTFAPAPSWRATKKRGIEVRTPYGYDTQRSILRTKI